MSKKWKIILQYNNRIIEKILKNLDSLHSKFLYYRVLFWGGQLIFSKISLKQFLKIEVWGHMSVRFVNSTITTKKLFYYYRAQNGLCGVD